MFGCCNACGIVGYSHFSAIRIAAVGIGFGYGSYYIFAEKTVQSGYADQTDKRSYIQMEQEYSVEDGETETEYVYSVIYNT